MHLVIAACVVGAIVVAAVIITMFSVLGRKNSTGRRADQVADADPRLAEELRRVQSQIDSARSGYRP